MATPRGKFIWYDVMTTDTRAAAAFYSDVIGWSAQEHQTAGLIPCRPSSPSIYRCAWQRKRCAEHSAH